MIERLKEALDQLRSSLWFVPGLLVLASVLLAVGMVWLDARFSREALQRFPRFFGVGAEASQNMLIAIATSMITVAGVTFSITVVAVAQAASQYSSRILRNFMRDRGNQLVLGVFVGVFTYCLVVLRTVRADEDLRFIPAISVLVAFVLAIVAIGFLIYFIHNIAQSLQASNLLNDVANETTDAVDRLFPQELGSEVEPEDDGDVESLLREHEWIPVPSPKSGYLQHVETADLLEFSREHDVIVRMDRGVGEFVVDGAPLVSLSAPIRVDDRVVDRLAGAFGIGSYRTVYQDAAFGVRQMVDVALKALSPASNDVTTAVNAIDYLSAVLAALAGRRIERRLRNGDGDARVIARGPTFVSLLDTAFDEIRDTAAGKVSVYGRLLTAIESVADFTDSGVRRRELRRHVELIREAARRNVEAPEALRAIERRCGELCARLP